MNAKVGYGQVVYGCQKYGFRYSEANILPSRPSFSNTQRNNAKHFRRIKLSNKLLYNILIFHVRVTVLNIAIICIKAIPVLRCLKAKRISQRTVGLYQQCHLHNSSISENNID